MHKKHIVKNYTLLHLKFKSGGVIQFDINPP